MVLLWGRRYRFAPDGNVRIDQQRTCSELWSRRDGPLAQIPRLDPSPKRGTEKIGTFETSDRHERVFRLTNRLRALTIGAHKAAPHPFPVAEAGVESDRLDRQAALL
jgi:hypothetical protein